MYYRPIHVIHMTHEHSKLNKQNLLSYDTVLIMIIPTFSFTSIPVKNIFKYNVVSVDYIATVSQHY